MKLDYKIIWVEDKIHNKPFISLREKIENFLENEFFKVSILTSEDFDEFKDKYETNNHAFDLIITDMNLNESHGSQVIDFIRDEKNILTEVFFYSANRNLSNSNLINNNRITFHQMDGVSAYNELGDSIIRLINLTISKFQNIVAMRGMIMHETSSLDAQTHDIASRYLNNNDDEVKDALFDELITFYQRKLKLSQKCKKNNNITKILKDPVILSFAQRVNVISKIIDKKGYVNFISEFEEEIIKIRNQFAHAELKKNTDGKEYFQKKGSTLCFDSILCKDIRKNIIKHSSNIEQLQAKLNSEK